MFGRRNGFCRRFEENLEGEIMNNENRKFGRGMGQGRGFGRRNGNALRRGQGMGQGNGMRLRRRDGSCMRDGAN